MQGNPPLFLTFHKVGQILLIFSWSKKWLIIFLRTHFFRYSTRIGEKHTLSKYKNCDVLGFIPQNSSVFHYQSMSPYGLKSSRPVDTLPGCSGVFSRRLGASAFFGAESACHTNCSEQDRIAQEQQAWNSAPKNVWLAVFFFWGGGVRILVLWVNSERLFRCENDVKRWWRAGAGWWFLWWIHEFWLRFIWSHA